MPFLIYFISRFKETSDYRLYPDCCNLSESQGCIYSVSVNSNTGSISRSHRNRTSRSKSQITSVQYRSFSLVARCPVLLVCAQDGYICFFRLAFGFIIIFINSFLLYIVCLLTKICMLDHAVLLLKRKDI